MAVCWLLLLIVGGTTGYRVQRRTAVCCVSICPHRLYTGCFECIIHLTLGWFAGYFENTHGAQWTLDLTLDSAFSTFYNFEIAVSVFSEICESSRVWTLWTLRL